MKRLLLIVTLAALPSSAQYYAQYSAPHAYAVTQWRPPFQAQPLQYYQRYQAVPQYQPQYQYQQQAPPQYAPQQPPPRPQYVPQSHPQYAPQTPQQYQGQANYAPAQQQFQMRSVLVQQPPPSPQQQQYRPTPSRAPPPAQPSTIGNSYQQKILREQPRIFQTIVKNPRTASSIGQQIAPPQPPVAPYVEPEIRAPVPPEKFVPYIADLYNAGPAVTAPTPLKKRPITVINTDSEIVKSTSLPAGTYISEDVIVDGNSPSYIEDVEKTQPQDLAPKKLIKQITRPAGDVVPLNNNIETRAIAQSATEKPKRTRKKEKETRTLPILTDAKTASDVFLGCCRHRKVAKSCERICSFDVLSKKTLTGMFLGTDPCPQSYGLDLLQCAAQDDDHTECCRSNGVHQTTAGKKCLGFCNMKPGVTFQADVSMLPCWGVLNDIKRCFKGNIEKSLM